MKKLTRSRHQRWIGGVCGGVADYTGIDVVLIRVVLAIAAVLGAGSLLVAYIVAWILIPRRPLHDTVWTPTAPAPAPAPAAPTTVFEPAQPSG